MKVVKNFIDRSKAQEDPYQKLDIETGLSLEDARRKAAELNNLRIRVDDRIVSHYTVEEEDETDDIFVRTEYHVAMKKIVFEEFIKLLSKMSLEDISEFVENKTAEHITSLVVLYRCNEGKNNT